MNLRNHLIEMLIFLQNICNIYFYKKYCKNILLEKVLQKYTFRKSIAKIYIIILQLTFGVNRFTPRTFYKSTAKEELWLTSNIKIFIKICINTK